MTKIVDARGMACPQPVIMTRNALQGGEPVTTIVDSDVARHNVTRMVQRAGAFRSRSASRCLGLTSASAWG